MKDHVTRANIKCLLPDLFLSYFNSKYPIIITLLLEECRRAVHD